MYSSTFRRYLVLGVLVVVLAAAGAAPANARNLNNAGSAWIWLQDIWNHGVNSLWNWHGHETPRLSRVSGTVPIVAKEGPGLDPNGSPASTGPTSSQPACTGCGDQGLGLDPNG